MIGKLFATLFIVNSKTTKSKKGKTLCLETKLIYIFKILMKNGEIYLTENGQVIQYLAIPHMCF